MMRSLLIIMGLLFTVLASPVLRSRVVQDTDASGTLVDTQGNPIDPEGNFLFNNVPILALANLEGAGSTGSVGTSLDLQAYQAATGGVTPTNFGDNVYPGQQGQQGSIIADADRVIPGWTRTVDNPCPRLHSLCSTRLHYFPFIYILDADPCLYFLNSPSHFLG